MSGDWMTTASGPAVLLGIVMIVAAAYLAAGLVGLLFALGVVLVALGAAWAREAQRRAAVREAQQRGPAPFRR